MRRHTLTVLLTFAVALFPMARSLPAQTPEARMKVYTAPKCAICDSIAGQGNKKLPLDGSVRS